ncbi:MAG: hypothetical protein JF588_03665 [Caulobacterales bacterium]|nr:hypothetical protein [Caulobacterales bacterium]
MRLFAAVLVAVCASASLARAADGLPKLRPLTPYSTVRSALAAAGFRPIAFRGYAKDDVCFGHAEVCRRYHEVYNCGPYACDFLFARRRDGRMVRVISVVDGRARGLERLEWLPAYEADDLAKNDFADPRDQRRLRQLAEQERNRPVKPPNLPLCSSDIRWECWVKPPAGYRSPRPARP